MVNVKRYQICCKVSALFLFIATAVLQTADAQQVQLKLRGTDSLQTKLMDSLSRGLTYPSLIESRKALDGQLAQYQLLGYIDAELLSTRVKNDSLFEAIIDLKQRIDTIYIYTPETTPLRNLINIESGKENASFFTLSISEVPEVLQRISRALGNEGRPFTAVKLTNLAKQSENSMRADLSISTSELRTIDGIVIRGYEKFPVGFLKHLLKIKTGQVLNLDNVTRKLEQLNNLPFAQNARPPELLFKVDSTDLYLYIEKRNNNSFDGFLGFGTNERTQRLDFDGYVNLRLLNNLNYGESMTLLYKSDENDKRTFDLLFDLPFIGRSPVGLELGLNIFKEDSTFTRITQKANVSYQFNATQKLYAGVQAIQSNDLLDLGQQDINDYNSTFLTLRYDFRRRQNQALFPVKSAASITVGFGERRLEEQRFNQQLLDIDATHILYLNARNSVYARLRVQALFSDTFLQNELFRFGGITSIRGFEENSLIASLYTLINTEYRYQLSDGLYVHTVFDAAYFENELSNQREQLYGLGLGFGLLTRAGLLKLNYATGKFENQNVRLSNSKVHISLTAYF